MSWLSSVLGEDSAKQSQNLTDQAVQTAQDIYGGLSPYRNAAGAALLTQPSQASLASLYGNNPTYSPVGNAGITNAGNAATATLNDLTTAAPNYEAQAMQTLKDFQTAAQPQLALGIRDINQAAGETGRVGAEGVTTSLGDLATTYANNLQAEENALASQTAQQQFGAEQAANQAALGQQGQLFGEAAQQQGVKNQLGQNAIQNTMGETGQQLGRGLSLAQLGYSNSPVGAYETGANADQNASNAAAQGAASLGSGLGTLFGPALGKAGTLLAGLL